MPTNGAHAERGDDSPDDRLRRELMRALGPSVLMSQTETAADAGPGRESERPPERSTERETGRPSERELAPPSARDPERPSGREPAREPGTPPEGELERPSARESERPPELGPGRPSERSAGRQRTSPPTEPVVRAAMRRARALTSGGSGQLDRELAELLEHSAVPVEISVEAASRELADRLGGAPVERRPTSGPATAARSGQPAGEDGAAAVDDELMPTSGRRTRASTEVEPSPESRAARLLRGE